MHTFIARKEGESLGMRLCKGTNGEYTCTSKYIYSVCVYTRTFEGNHCLVDAILRVRIVVSLELLFHCSDDGHNLLQPMEPRLIPQR